MENNQKDYTDYELSEYIKKARAFNNEYDSRLENIKLSNSVNKLKQKNEKIPKMETLIENYKKKLADQNKELTKLKNENEMLLNELKRMPKFIRDIFVKNNKVKELFNKK